MKTLQVAACVLLMTVVALLSAGRSQEQPTAPHAPTFLSLVKVGDYVGMTWRTDSRVLTVYSPEEGEERIKQETERRDDIKSLGEQFNATEDEAKRDELRRRMQELSGPRGITTFMYQVTAVGADYIGLSSRGTRVDTTRSARDLYVPAWSISSLSRARSE